MSIVTGALAPQTSTDIKPSKWDNHLHMMLRGAIGGLVAGVVFGVFQMWFLADAGLPANTIIHMIATIVQPDEYFAAGQTSLAVGWAVHVGLSIAYGAILGLICTEFRSNITRVVAACVWGLLIYMFNFLVLAPFFYPIFTTANQPFEGTVHVVYGALLAPFLVRWSGRARREPELPPVVAQWIANGGQEQPAQVQSFNPAHLR